jgi:hypothetical protein
VASLSSLLRFQVALALAVGIVAARAETASGCEICRRLGTTAFHVESAGGDDLRDALVPPAATGGATLQFVQQGGHFPQPGGRGTPVTITYSYNNMFDGGLKDINGVPLPASLIRGSIEEALRVWSRHAPLNFIEVPDEERVPSFSDYPDGQIGEIRFSHLYYNGPDVPGQPPTAKALAYFYNGSTNLAADVFFDHSDPWQEMGTLPRPDILGAAIHEIGHTLGLGHTDDPTANMYWIFHRFAGLGTGQLFPDDIAGIQSIYGAGVGSVTPLIMVPEPAAIALITLGVLWTIATKRGRRS